MPSVVDSGDHAVLHCDGEHREQGALSALAAGGAAGPIQGKSDLRPEGTAFLSPHQGGTHGQQALVLQALSTACHKDPKDHKEDQGHQQHVHQNEFAPQGTDHGMPPPPKLPGSSEVVRK